MIAQGCQKSRQTSNRVIAYGGPKQRWGRFKLAIFDQHFTTVYISETVQGRDIVTMER